MGITSIIIGVRTVAEALKRKRLCTGYLCTIALRWYILAERLRLPRPLKNGFSIPG